MRALQDNIFTFTIPHFKKNGLSLLIYEAGVGLVMILPMYPL